MESQTQAEPHDKLEGRFILRCSAAVVVVLTICTYIIAIVLGRIPMQQKLGGAEISLVVVAAAVVSILLQPELLHRLTHLKFGGNLSSIGCKGSRKTSKGNAMNSMLFGSC